MILIKINKNIMEFGTRLCDAFSTIFLFMYSTVHTRRSRQSRARNVYSLLAINLQLVLLFGSLSRACTVLSTHRHLFVCTHMDVQCTHLAPHLV